MNRMTAGQKMAACRRAKGMSQQELAERIRKPVGTLRSWEADEENPNPSEVHQLSCVLDVPADELAHGASPVKWQYRGQLSDEKRMYVFILNRAEAADMRQTRLALPFMRRAHEGQMRKSQSEMIPYEVHPLTMACHALMMGIEDDDVIAALLLHDVVEDTNYAPEDLPVSDRVRAAVRLVSYNTYPGAKEDIKPEYYRHISECPLASLIKCIDRCNNVSCMADGFTKKRMAEYVRETEEDILPLLETAASVPAWNNAVWLVRYQLHALLETFKHLL